MDENRKIKMSLLAASALVAAAGALAPAHASDVDAAAYPATIEAPVAAHAVDQADQKQSPTAKRLAIIAVAGGAFAALIRILGFKKVYRAVGTTAKRAAAATADAAGNAAKTVGRTLRSPLRFMAWMAGLVLIALTGVGFYDIEWIGGLIVGAAMASVAVYGAAKLRFQTARVKIKREYVNRN